MDQNSKTYCQHKVCGLQKIINALFCLFSVVFLFEFPLLNSLPFLCGLYADLSLIYCLATQSPSLSENLCIKPLLSRKMSHHSNSFLSVRRSKYRLRLKLSLQLCLKIRLGLSFTSKRSRNFIGSKVSHHPPNTYAKKFPS